MLKKLWLTVAVFVIMSSACLYWTNGQLNQLLAQPVKAPADQLLTIKSGMSFNGVIYQLTKKKWISDSVFNKLMAYRYPELTEIKAGTYDIEPLVSLHSLLTRFVEGDEHSFSITFIEGSRFSEWRAQLEKAPYLTHETKGLTEQEIGEKLGITEPILEGLFLPQTYHYSAGESDLKVLARAHSHLKDALSKAWENKSKNLPIKNAYEALILASIIEKETAIGAERGLVASVFVNRLNKGMRLQTDPTVIYGMKDKYDGNIRKKDLLTPTPYNTYVIKGLPPTPIAMPSQASIDAALAPLPSDYFYFVADGKGGHVFSTSLTSHNKAVRAYLKQLRNNQ